MAFGRDARAALVTVTLSLASSLSTSALIFSGPIQQFIGLGLSAALITATIAALITSVGSGFAIAIGSPSSTIAASLAVTVAALDPILVLMPSARALSLVVVLLATISLTTGLVLLFLGVSRLGKIIRFIPFSVVAGFMGTSGFLLATGAIRMTTQVPLAIASFHELLRPKEMFELIAIAAWAAILATAAKRLKFPATIPCLLVAGVLTSNIALVFLPQNSVRAFLADSMFQTTTQSPFAFPLLSSLLSQNDWMHIVVLIPNILAIVFITVLTVLLTCTGLETALDVDADFDRELRIQGAANIASALTGGYVGMTSIGTTLAGKAAGASGRLVGVLTGVICLFVLLGGQDLVNDVPRFIVGGLQLQIGIQLLWTWCVASRKTMPMSEWLLVLAIVGVAAWFGFGPAVFCGVVGGCIVFAVDVSRIDVVRRVYAISDRSSPLVRSAAEAAVLLKSGGMAQVVEMNGYIFFGSAYQMVSTIKSLVAVGVARLIVLDFTSVTGADSSTATVLGRLEKRLRRASVRLVFTGLKPELLKMLTGSGAIDPSVVILADRNAALEFAEHFILTQTGLPPSNTISLTSWLAQSLGRRDFAEELVPMLEVEDLAAGAYICRQGEPTDSLIFIESGRVAVMVEAGTAEICVRVFGAHTIAGEQGFILKQPRSASLKVEEQARIWSLSRGTYDKLLMTHADLVIALMGDIVRLQSERLTFATRHNAVMAG